MTQYVKLSPQEQVFGEKGLLQSQASLLVITKRLRNYKKLRIEELMLKLLLKKKLGEVKESFSMLDNLLPPAPIRKEKPIKKAGVIEVQEEIVEEVVEEKPKVKTLEDEIDEIRQKIARLS
jgi:hypothetical protein